MISDTTYNPAPSISAVRRRRGHGCSYCHRCCTSGATAQPWIRVVALAAMWRDSCQQDGKPKSSATLQLSPIGRRLIPYHCSVLLFVTIGIRDITDVDTDSLANNTGVYLCQ